MTHALLVYFMNQTLQLLPIHTDKNRKSNLKLQTRFREFKYISDRKFNFKSYIYTVYFILKIKFPHNHINKQITIYLKAFLNCLFKRSEINLIENLTPLWRRKVLRVITCNWIVELSFFISLQTFSHSFLCLFLHTHTDV